MTSISWASRWPAFTTSQADGFGTDTFGWYDSVYLRVDYLSARLHLVLEVEGEWSVEASFPIDELHDALVDARIGDADPQDLLC